MRKLRRQQISTVEIRDCEGQLYVAVFVLAVISPSCSVAGLIAIEKKRRRMCLQIVRKMDGGSCSTDPAFTARYCDNHGVPSFVVRGIAANRFRIGATG